MQTIQQQQQEIYDRVKAHLQRQGKPSFDEHGECAYRGANGTKCAVGCLITDRAFAQYIGEDTNCCTINTTEVLTALTASGIFNVLGHLALLHELQVVHDVSPPPKWKERLAEVALNRGLEP